MKITKRQLRRIIREEMNPGAQGTPDEIMGDASSESDSGSGFSPEKKAAMGFINNSMGATPSADQLAGMDPQIQDYARQQGVGAGALKHQLNKMLPSTGQHPDFQVDSASGSVSSTDGRKVYGEGMKITKRQLKRIIREQVSQPGLEEMLANLDDELFAVIEEALNAPIRLIQERIGDMLGEKITGDYAGASAPDIVSDVQDVLLRYARNEYMNHTADLKAAEEILNTRMGSYKGTTLPGGEKVK